MKEPTWFLALSWAGWGQANDLNTALKESRAAIGSSFAKDQNIKFTVYHVSDDFVHENGSIRAEVVNKIGNFDHNLKSM